MCVVGLYNEVFAVAFSLFCSHRRQLCLLLSCLRLAVIDRLVLVAKRRLI